MRNDTYRSESSAVTLKGTADLHLRDAQIVDLSKAYPNLPSGIIEIWLGSGQS